MTAKNGVGVTEIGHDSESRTLVSGYERPGSYRRPIRYNVHDIEMIDIIKQSSHCEQFIKYECRGSVLNCKGVAYGWWVSRQGYKMRWKCQGWKCNCDKNSGGLREDSGYVTDKNRLPVSELRFGDTGSYYECGYHTLGKLLCWG